MNLRRFTYLLIMHHAAVFIRPPCPVRWEWDLSAEGYQLASIRWEQVVLFYAFRWADFFLRGRRLGFWSDRVMDHGWHSHRDAVPGGCFYHHEPEREPNDNLWQSFPILYRLERDFVFRRE